MSPQKILFAKRGGTGGKVGALDCQTCWGRGREYFVGILSMQSFMDFEIVFSRAHNIAALKGTWETFAFGVGFFMFCEMTVCSVRIAALLTDKWTLTLAQISRGCIPLQYG